MSHFFLTFKTVAHLFSLSLRERVVRQLTDRVVRL